MTVPSSVPESMADTRRILLARPRPAGAAALPDAAPNGLLTKTVDGMPMPMLRCGEAPSAGGDGYLLYPAPGLPPRVRRLLFEVKDTTPHTATHRTVPTRACARRASRIHPKTLLQVRTNTSHAAACLSWWLHCQSQPRLVRAKLQRRVTRAAPRPRYIRAFRRQLTSSQPSASLLDHICLSPPTHALQPQFLTPKVSRPCLRPVRCFHPPVA